MVDDAVPEALLRVKVQVVVAALLHELDEVLDDLEEVLITSDVGVNTTLKIIERIEARISKEKYVGADELKQVLRDEIASLLEESSGIENQQKNNLN